MEYTNVLTTCTYCGCGCNFYLENLDGSLTGTIPCKTSPVNEGRLCIKGWNAHEFVQSDQRLTSPLVRKDGQLVPVSWDEALEYTASELTAIRSEHGPDSLAFLASAKVTNEENFLLQKFARAAVGTNNIDHCARLWHSSTVAGLATAFGSGAMTNSIGDIEESDCIFITGSNTSSSHPIIADRVHRARERGAKVIVADPRRIHMARMADIHVQQNLGTDVALLNGIMHVILEQGWQDQQFIDERCEGFEALRETVRQYTPSAVEEITGVPAGDIERVAELYGRANAASILYCMGITQHTTGVDNVKSLANLVMLTGNIGRPGTGLNPLRGQNNVQGACDMGGLPNVFSGYQQVANSEANSKFASAWQADLPDRPGLPLPDMIAGLEDGSVQGLYVLGENPVMSDPDTDHVSQALQKARLVVVQDIFLTETARQAHVVLPGVSFAEKDGTFTNTERRVMRVRKAVEPVGDSRQDWEIIQDLSNRLGYSMSYSSPEEIMQEIAGLTPQYGGVTYERLEGDGLQWPCPDTEHPGTKILHQERFSRGLGLFHAVEHQPPAESVDREYPYWLTTGRIYTHYHTGTMTRNSPTLEREAPEGWMEIHPDDARELGVRNGDTIRVASRRGSVEAAAYLTDDVSQGTVFMTFHYVESNANVLTNPATDPVARIPEYKVCAVSLEKAA